MAGRKPKTAKAADTAADSAGIGVHRIPVIDKMMKLLELIEQSRSDVGINALTEMSGVPRSTVYRILNTLASHGVVARTGKGNYKLSYRLVSLAAHVDTEITAEVLKASARPFLESLATDTGETCKLSIIRGPEAEVLDVVIGPDPMAPSSRVGSRFPLHAGAASKLLLAFGSAPLQKQVLDGPKEKFTESTIADRDALQAELTSIRQAGLSHDRGEWNMSVHAIAAPVRGVSGQVIAALSITFFASPGPAPAPAKRIASLVAAAEQLSTQLGHRTTTGDL